MSIIRVKKDKSYFAASNKPFNDKVLSWEARGVMGYLLSKPDDWQLRFFDLVNQGPAGEYKVRRVLKELEDNGYLERERIKKEDGTFDWISTVFETPTISRKPIYGDTISRLPTCGASTDGKPRDIVSTDSIITDIKEEDINTNGKYTEYEQAFCNATRIPPLTPNPRKWFEACEKLGDAGVEAVDIERAVEILRDRDYSIIGLSSIVNTAINEMSKRVSSRGGKAKDPSRFVEGDLADYIEH